MNVDAPRRFRTATPLLSAALVAVVGAACLSAPGLPGPASVATATDAAKSLGNLELAADQQITWIVEEGQVGADNYASMISSLRAAARNAGGHRDTVHPPANQTNSGTRNIDVTSTSSSQQFADIVASLRSGVTMHIRIRLSDMYLVQLYGFEQRPNSSGQRTFGYNLAPGLPAIDRNVAGSGKVLAEGYDAIARRGNTSLQGFGLGPAQFTNAIQVLHNNTSGVGVQHYRAFLTLILGISEAVRFAPIANNVYGAIKNHGTYSFTGSDVDAIHLWGRASDLYDGTNTNSITLWGVAISTAYQIAKYLLTVKGKGAVPSDEL